MQAPDHDPWMVRNAKGRARVEEPKPDYVMGDLGHLGPAADWGRRGPVDPSSSTSSPSEQLPPRGRFSRSSWRQSRQLPQQLARAQRAWADELYNRWLDQVDDPAWPDKLERVIQNYVNAQGGLHQQGIGDNCTAEVEWVLKHHMRNLRAQSNEFSPYVAGNSGFPGPPA